MSQADPFLNQAVAKLKVNDIAAGIEFLRKAVEADRFHAHAWFLLGMALSHTDAQDEAIKCVDRAMMFAPEDPRYKFEFSKLLKANFRREEALSLLEQVTNQSPSQGGVVLEYLRELMHAGKYDRAIEVSQWPHPYGEYEEAIRQIRVFAMTESFRIPELVEWCHQYRTHTEHSQTLIANAQYQCLIYESLVSPTEALAFIRESGSNFGNDDFEPPASDTFDPNRQLRIVFVSPDFKMHSVAFFLRSVFANWDTEASRLVLASTRRAPGDTIQEEFRNIADEWHDIESTETDAVVAQLKALNCDIAVDLSGRTDGNRLDVFARRIAPVQVTYLGSAWSTGIDAMDYRIVDTLTDPIGSDIFDTETLVRLEPPFLCYRPEDYSVFPNRHEPISDEIMFGCFSIVSKISTHCVQLWAKVLKAIPNSKLALKNKSFRDQATADRVRAAFEAKGVGEQIEIWPFSASHEAHFDDYNRVDIMLDTFPYAGTTTTCEALWMGVPVISLIGQQHASRVGLSVLTSVGLGDCATDSVEQFVSKAVELAQDSDRRKRLRAYLRADMLASPLCNGALMSQKLQGAFREMWKAKCDEVTANG